MKTIFGKIGKKPSQQPVTVVNYREAILVLVLLRYGLLDEAAIPSGACNSEEGRSLRDLRMAHQGVEWSCPDGTVQANLDAEEAMCAWGTPDFALIKQKVIDDAVASIGDED